MTSLWDKEVAKLSKEDQKMFRYNSADHPEILLRAILAKLDQQLDHCQRSRYRITGIHGKEIVIRDVCAKINTYVKHFFDVVGTVVQFDPIHTALPWAGLRFLLELSLRSIGAFEKVVEGLEKATSVIARYAIVEALYLPAQSDAQIELEKGLQKLYAGVLSFLCEAAAYFKRSRLTKPFTNIAREKTLEDGLRSMIERDEMVQVQKGLVDGQRISSTSIMIENIYTAHATLRNKLNQLEQPIVRGMDQVSDLHDALQDAERHALLQWLSRVETEKHHRAALSSLLPQSGQWLLGDSRHTTWRDSSTSDTLWLHGIPGCGKTKLTATVVEHLRVRRGSVPHPVPIAHFYCSRKEEPERSDACQILRSLVRQLSLTADGHVRPAVVDEYETRRKEGKLHGELAAELTAEESTKLICAMGDTSPTTILIDALDECSSSQRDILLSALATISSDSRDVVKIFISSRNDEEIGALLRSTIEVCVTTSVTAEDLRRFVTNNAAELKKKWLLIPHGDGSEDERMKSLESLEKALVDTLIHRAQGMFLWVRLQLERLSNTHLWKGEDIREALNSLPPTLADTYKEIHRRVQEMGKRAKAIVTMALQWLLCGQRMLSAAEFLAALGRSSDDLDQPSRAEVLNFCGGLVVFDAASHMFRLAHSTVREFLESSDEYSMHESHLSITKRCLGTYIWESCSNDGLLDYATQYWPAHCEILTEPATRAAVSSSLIELFTAEEHFEDWLQNLEGSTPQQQPEWGSSLARKLNGVHASPPSPLFAICYFGLTEVLEYPEIITDLDLEQKNTSNASGLYVAARWGHTTVVKQLLSQGADVNSRGDQFGTALQAAAFAGHQEIVELLLANGARLAGSGDFSTPLQAALASGQKSIVDLLFKRGFQFSTQQQFDDAFETASFSGYADVVQQLLDGKAGDYAPKFVHDPLQMALHLKKKRLSLSLMRSCPDINAQQGYFGDALQAAISGGLLSLVKSVLDAGAKLDQRGRFGYPLRAAAIAGKADIVQHLLDQGADPNARDDELGDPLQAAASKDYRTIMSILLAHKADVDGHGGFYGNTLQAASFAGHEQAVRLLIENGARINEYRTGRFRDAIQAAVHAGQEKIVGLLLEKGAELHPGRRFRIYPFSASSETKRRPLPRIRDGTGNLDIPNELGPLEVAARCGNKRLIQVLLDSGAPVDAEDADSQDDEYDGGCAFTALQIAAYWGHVAAVNCLIENGADVNAVRQTLGTPLRAAMEGSHWDVARLLLTKGAEIDKHWMVFGSCLQVFCERGDVKAVRFLCEQGANIEDNGGLNGNALQVACDAGKLNVVQFLLKQGANANSAGRNNGTALQAASAAGHVDVVGFLLDHNAEVNTLGCDHESALQAASANGHLGVVRLLVERCALVDAVEGSVGSPLQLAAYFGHENVVAFLLTKDAKIHLESTLPSQRSFQLNERGYQTQPADAFCAACKQDHAEIARLLFTRDPWGFSGRKVFVRALEASLECNRANVPAMLVRESVRAGFTPENFDHLFHFACEKGHDAFMEQLLEHIPLAFWPSEQTKSPLHTASYNGRSGVVACLIKSGVEVNRVNDAGESTVEAAMKGMRYSSNHHSSYHNKPDILGVVRNLVEAGAVVTELTKHKEDLMHLIFQNGDAELLTALEKLECSFFPASDHFSEALNNAAKMGHLSMVRYLTQTTRPRSSEAVQDAIVSAADSGYKDIIKALLDLKVHMTFSKESPIVAASARGHAGIVELLLQAIPPDTKILHNALEQVVSIVDMSRFFEPTGQPVDTIKLLLEYEYKGMDRRQICSHLLSTSSEYSGIDIMNHLLSEGADPDTRNAAGETMLYLVCKDEFAEEDQAKAFVRRGADVNLEGGEYGTPLRVAASTGNDKIAAILLDAGADPNFCSPQHGTCLTAIMAQQWIWTCNHKSGPFKESVGGCCRCFARSLLEHGADVDAERGSSGTALQVAASIGNEEGVRMLLDWGADVNVESGESGNALKAARVALDRFRAEDEKIGDTPVATRLFYEKKRHKDAKKSRETIIQLLLDAGSLEGGD